MKRPDNINEALLQLHNLTMAIAQDLLNYVDRPQDFDLASLVEYFEDVKDAALDAHLLVTWVRDNLTEGESK